MLKRTAHKAVLGTTLGVLVAGTALGFMADGDGSGSEARQRAGSHSDSKSATEGGSESLAARGGEGAEDGRTVRTDKGRVSGKVTERTRTFLGIPYAAAPDGPHRWKPPRKTESWDGTRDATKPSAACPQSGKNPIKGPPSDNENCLALNVTTPRGVSPSEQLPVMVYLHGGDHEDGSGAMFRAQRLADQGEVMVVTVNYRLGALGYLAHPNLEGADGKQSGNYGLQDQQEALRWVQRNAEAFGGDPERVTLFGESGGARSVCANLVSPASARLFHRAIVQSGPCTDDENQRDRKEALADGKRFAEQLKGTSLRDASAKQLVRADDEETPFGPVYGTELLPRTPQKAFASGKFNKVPVLQGVTRDEERLMTWGMEIGKRQQTGDPEAKLTEKDYRGALTETYGKRKAARILAQYPVEDYDDSPALALSAAMTDARWARPAHETNTALASRVPTYGYEFADTQMPAFRELPEGARKPSFPFGAAHTAELSYLFEVDYAQKLNARQSRVADTMIDSWAQFARTGKADWQRFRPDKPYVQAFEPGGAQRTDFAEEHHYDFWKSLEG